MKFNWKLFWSGLPKFLLIVVFLYVTVAFITYRFRHPDMTETQLFLNIFEALMFR